MGITGSFINNAVARNPKGTIQEPFDKTIEGAKAVTEVYDGNDKANITPTLNSIEIQLASTDLNFAFKSKKAELEKEINILHCKHPNARPIKLAYDSASKTLDLTTYGETVKLDILSGKYLVSTPYSNVTWPAASLAEAIRIANLTNFLTATYA
ncbi:hypothetical protein KAZ93_02970 [Patescibacteria group bacterium]|nr:hypothetical protein [Patescibacteria group bacterium]